MGDARVVSTSSQHLTLLGRTNFRDTRKIFGIRQSDRLAHLYALGKTGTGKSTLLETMMRQDLLAGRGFALLDPHGDLVERVRAAVPPERQGDLVYFNAPEASLAFNPIERVPPEKRAFVASTVLEVFKKIWFDFWGPRMEHILRNALLTLLDQPVATLGDVLRLLDDPAYRRAAVALVRTPQVRDFWLKEFAQYPERLRGEAIAPIQNKVGAFLAHPVLNRILTRPRSSFDLRRVMDEGKILLVNLSKGRLGEDGAALLGALLVSTIGSVGLGRSDIPESARRDFFVYLDEFQLFTTRSMANMLSELRKYHVGLVLAHQYLAQLDESVRDAILGNVGSIVAFRLGLPDAEILAKDFPPFSAQDFTHLPNYQVYLRLMVNGLMSEPFSAETLSPSDIR
jgi:hypothetical protein